MRRCYPKRFRGHAAIFSPFFFMTSPRCRRGNRVFPSCNDGDRKGNAMIKSTSFAAELGLQIALAAAIGLSVSLLLGACALLLAA